MTPENRLFILYHVQGKNPAGQSISENRLMEVLPEGGAGPPVRVPLKTPFTGFFTATVRADSPPSKTLELLGHPAGKPMTVRFARIQLW